MVSEPQRNGRYSGTITYYRDHSLFQSPRLEFSEHAYPSISESSPHSYVFTRAQFDFSEEGYAYVAPPLFLGKHEIEFPEQEIYVLRLLVKAPGTAFIIPESLSFLKHILQETGAYQRVMFPAFEERFVYVTIRSGVVRSKRDDELHVDGFQGTSVPRHIPEQNYIWADCWPTIFSMQAYFVENLDPGKHNIHTHFEAVTRKANLLSGVNKGLYVIDPYHVHLRPPESSGKKRSFVRICYSPVEIRDDTCTFSPWLARGPYGRSEVRDYLVDYDGTTSESLHGLTPLPSSKGS